MNAKVLILLTLLWPVTLWAQGFAGLGSTADGFATPQRGTPFDFPTDHGAHPDYRIEWWYLTANLTGADGRDYGIQWTLFRSALAPETSQGWQDPQVWLGHVGLTTPDAHFTAERFARGGVGQAGVIADPFRAWIDEWAMQGSAGDGLNALTLSAQGDDFGYDLGLRADGPLVAQGQGGYSVKSAAGQASYYYSQPFYQIAGTLHLPGGPVEVTGQGWLDREWSSQPLAADQTGWDWISLHFDDGTKLMGFALRDDGAGYTSATWIAPDGKPTSYGDGALTLTPLETSEVAGRDVPTRWQVDLPDKGIAVTIDALNPQSWMGLSFPYWEGPVRIEGSHPGRGYLEMTGY
ncbi:lipocalin-like domain-containing protein [Actibacterium sp. 188UL27-1]|uniref:lipocalin-like domain-containing protein n=1 Tax=Actibacterium sp. 188UL27-1 TaxID=2786961 RepID=UPI00195ED361|nr:lipocalin-like domain-containing protein [Actibacterium sp. 188UL27-1]MBM7069223.1 iron ABC transporter permease [Actibacterium sp. 188UL27-1]